MSSTSATSRPPLIQVQEASSQQTEFSNPKSYAQAVNAYAQTTQQQSLYAGNSFEALAHFLRSSGQIAEKETSEPSKTILVEPHRPFRRDTLKLASSAQRGLGEPFATHYALTSGNDAPEVRHLVEPAELEPVAKACSQDKMGQLLILRGYPSAAWLCTVGALYDVDPEFFRRHLDFILTSDSDLIPDGTPEMPSSTTNIFRFRIPTVGSYMGSVHQFGESPLQALRNAAKTAMTRYGHWLRIGTKWKIGDSVVRQFHVHNKEHFSIEQAVTIYFSRLRQSWDSWIVIIFLDSGIDPSLCQWPDIGLPVRHLPVPHQRRALALKADRWKEEPATPLPNSPSKIMGQGIDPSPRAQSLSRLHLRYGRFLRPEIMYQDPFYTLSELFSILSCSEAQILDVLESDLARDSWLAIQEDDIKVSGWTTLGRGGQQTAAHAAQDNLVHIRHMLEARTANLSGVVDFVNRHQHGAELGYSSWPHAADAQQLRESHTTAKALELDFAHLLARARALSDRCESSMTLAMNRASIGEARRSIQQGQILSRFTVLAFVFVPATATASIFGMNFRELGTGNLTIGIYFAVAAPIFWLSFMFLFDGWRRSWTAAMRLYNRSIGGEGVS